MSEMRWVKDDQGHVQLQQRTRSFVVDASGNFCGLTGWSDWEAVPIVQDFFQFREVKQSPEESK